MPTYSGDKSKQKDFPYVIIKVETIIFLEKRSLFDRKNEGMLCKSPSFEG